MRNMFQLLFMLIVVPGSLFLVPYLLILFAIFGIRPNLSLANSQASFQLIPTVFSSSSTLLRQVVLGLPLFLLPWSVHLSAILGILSFSLGCPSQCHFRDPILLPGVSISVPFQGSSPAPWGVHLSDILGILSCSMRSVCPNHLSLLLLTSSVTGLELVLSQSFSFVIWFLFLYNQFLVPSFWFLGLGSWLLVLDFQWLVVCSWFLVPYNQSYSWLQFCLAGSFQLIPSSWFLILGGWFLLTSSQSWFLILGGWLTFQLVPIS